MMGVLVNPSSNSLPITHSHDYRALYGIMTGVGLFSDSTHSIRSANSSVSSFSFFVILFVYSFFVFPSFYSDLASLRNDKVLNSLFHISNE